MSQKLAIRRRAHGLEVLGRKRVCRLWDWNPAKSFAAIGITTVA
jgi:hypothetical protein